MNSLGRRITMKTILSRLNTCSEDFGMSAIVLTLKIERFKHSFPDKILKGVFKFERTSGNRWVYSQTSICGVHFLKNHASFEEKSGLFHFSFTKEHENKNFCEKQLINNFTIYNLPYLAA